VTHVYEDNVPRLRIAPEVGAQPVILPDWMKIPYIIETEVDDTGLEPDVLPAAAIRHGDRLEHPSGGYGTVGAFMMSLGDIYVITAGHVVEGGQNNIFDLKHALTTGVAHATRLPQLHPDNNDRWAKEAAGLLKLRHVDRTKVDYSMPSVHVYDFASGEPKNFDLEHGQNRGLYFLDQLKGGALKVYKEGATTGRTVGTLREIIRHMPKAFYVMDGLHVTQTPKEDLKMDALGITLKELKSRHAHRWVGVVEWVHPTIPFSAPGDSGSLVYAMKNTAVVPLGIHIGRPNGRPGCSLFLALESFLLEGELHGLNLYFP
jgi:hypothetical protein